MKKSLRAAILSLVLFSAVGVSPLFAESQSSFLIGSRVQTTDAVRVRQSPSLSGKNIKTEPISTQGTIIDGPLTTNGYAWIKVQYDDKVVGWSVSDYFTTIAAKASGLTQNQIDAIVSLLQSFGATSDVIANVRLALGVSVVAMIPSPAPATPTSPTPTPAPTPPSQVSITPAPTQIPASLTSTIVFDGSQQCVDAGATINGSTIQTWACWGGSNQNFTATLVGTNTYQIKLAGTNTCLDVDSTKISTNGATVQLWDCWGGQNQLWRFETRTDGKTRIVSNASNKCLDAYTAVNGTQLFQWDCWNGAPQAWQLKGATFPVIATIATPAPAPTSAPNPTPVPVSVEPTTHTPVGISGQFTSLIDATFGTTRSDSTIRTRADLDKIAYYWFEYGPSNTDPRFWTQADAPNNCMGPRGDGTDGLYGNFYSRFMHCAPGSVWDRHVLGADKITLKANCGLQDNNPANCSDANIGGGMIRFSKSFRPTATKPIVVEMRGIMPKGMYSWPAFWINPGEQNPRNADGSPGSMVSLGWPPEIDIFDNFGFDNTPPGHFLILGTPTQGNDAAYASAACASQGISVCDIPLSMSGSTLPVTSVAKFDNWYATTNADLTAGWHTYGAKIYPDHIDALLDGVVYRSRGYSWPTTSAPMQLMVSNQTGAKFNTLSGITDQGGVPNGWDWQISYVRVWQQN